MATAPRCAYLNDKEVLIVGWMKKAPPDRKMRKKGGIAKVITYMNCTSPRFTRDDSARSAHTRWQRRFFVLFKPRGGLHDEYLLEYFTDESCTRKKGSVDLKNCTEIAAFDQSVPDKFALSLHTLDRNRNRIYYLSCNTEDEMNEWVTYLTNVCKMEFRGGDAPEPLAHERVEYPTTSSSHMSQWRYDGSFPSLSTPSSHPESPFFTGAGDPRQPTPPQLPPMRRAHQESAANGERPVPGPRGRPLPPPTHDLNYDVLPTGSHCDSGIYQVPPPGSEEYYNVTGGGVRPDSVYHYPADPYNRPVSSGQPPSHEYINLTQTEEDVYKVPPEGPPSPPAAPPRIPPRTTLRYSLIRRQQQAAAQPPPPRQGSSIYNVPPPPPPPPAAQRGYPPASPTADQQHEYLNLWSADTAAPADSKKPVSINDVPPIVPPLPERLRHRNEKSSSTSSSLSSSSSGGGGGSCRSSRTSSSGQVVAGAVVSSAAVPPLNSMPDLPTSVKKCSLGDDNGGDVVTRQAPSPNSDGHVSYLCAEELVFLNSRSSNPNRPASLTEYNELDKLKTKALAQLAEDMAKNNK